MDTSILIVLVVLVVILSVILIFLFKNFNLKQNTENDDLLKVENEQLKEDLREKSELISENAKRIGAAESSEKIHRERIEKLEEEVAKLRSELNQKSELLTAAETKNEELQKNIEVQKTELQDLNKRLTAEFENIANKITKTSTEELSKVNTEKIDNILKPFNEKLQELRQQVSDAYDKEARDKEGLRKEIEQLTKLNQKMSEDATNLTNALKGDVKKQGNWGELVLERILDMAGLNKGEEYEREVEVDSNEEGKLRPDVVVNLPEGKHIIVDSKVSLTAYNEMIKAENKEDFEKWQKAHVLSVRSHIDELGNKSYQNLKNFDAPDYVLMFMPIESSFSVATQADTSLYEYALKKNVVIVTPTTLLATLRTVSSIWKREKQNRNTLEIAKTSGILYDKLVGFLEEMKKIEKALNSAQSAYGEAYKKLTIGRGNAIATAEKIKALGVKTSKSIPEEFSLGTDDVTAELTN